MISPQPKTTWDFIGEFVSDASLAKKLENKMFELFGFDTGKVELFFNTCIEIGYLPKFFISEVIDRPRILDNLLKVEAFFENNFSSNQIDYKEVIVGLISQPGFAQLFVDYQELFKEKGNAVLRSAISNMLKGNKNIAIIFENLEKCFKARYPFDALSGLALADRLLPETKRAEKKYFIVPKPEKQPSGIIGGDDEFPDKPSSVKNVH